MHWSNTALLVLHRYFLWFLPSLENLWSAPIWWIFIQDLEIVESLPMALKTSKKCILIWFWQEAQSEYFKLWTFHIYLLKFSVLNCSVVMFEICKLEKGCIFGVNFNLENSWKKSWTFIWVLCIWTFFCEVYEPSFVKFCNIF